MEQLIFLFTGSARNAFELLLMLCGDRASHKSSMCAGFLQLFPFSLNTNTTFYSFLIAKRIWTIAKMELGSLTNNTLYNLLLFFHRMKCICCDAMPCGDKMWNCCWLDRIGIGMKVLYVKAFFSYSVVIYLRSSATTHYTMNALN